MGTLADYMFPVWDFHARKYDRWSINFFLFKGSELPELVSNDDELQISQVWLV